MANLFIKKPVHTLLAEAGAGNELKRTLGKWGLVALGIGAIIGSGLFVRTAAASAEHAGPSIVLSFVLAGIGCAFAGLCYSEFAAMIPISGSAYTYTYATMGEFVAWIIGWDLVLEYAIGAATVAISWAEYFNKFIYAASKKRFAIPYQWCHSPFQSSVDGIHGIINIPAVCIIFLLTLVLIKGIRESVTVNAVIVILKVTIVIFFIAIGWQFISPANLHPFVPPKTSSAFGAFGFGGIVAGAGVVFFAFIGFDAISTAAQETKNPKKDMPFGILVSLAICTVLYILFAYVLTGVANYKEFLIAGKEASVAYAIDHHMPGYGWFSIFVTLAILFGFSSVILVMLLGQSRVFFTMSKDGLVPKVFSDLHPRFKTPYKSNILFFIFVGLFAAFVPEDVVGDMTSIGTLFAFILVCLGVVIMRKRDPVTPRPFRVPLSPVVPILGALVCGFMVYGLGRMNWARLIVWMLIGFVIYFSYSRRNSKLGQAARGGQP
jgi:APA family basic amino acid/polyamine antiporter